MYGEDDIVDMYESANEEDEIDNALNETDDEPDEYTPVEFQQDAVSALNQCQTHEARKLCILNIEYKMENSDSYDIGGTYTKDNPDLWFFCTTSLGPANRLLNIFVFQRKKGIFQISFGDNPLTIQRNESKKLSNSINKLNTKTFTSAQNDKCHYITTYCFKPDDFTKYNKTFCIPILINFDPKCPIDTDVLMKVKANHCLTGIFRRDENTDFVLESSSGKKFNVHKLVLAAHSHVIKEIVRNSQSNKASLDIDDDEMDVLLEFLYTGKVKSVLHENCYKLIDVAYKFKLDSLITLLKLVIIQKINVNNAVEIAVLTEKYKLDNIQEDVFEFIKKNPEVLESDGWKNLNDVGLTKKLFKMIYVDSKKSNE